MDPDETAAVVLATVVSEGGDRFVLDAGAKALTKDRPEWLPGFGEVDAYPDVMIEKLSDYHGVTRVPPLARRPNVGEQVAIVPNHICPVVDLVSTFAVVAPDGRIERWPVDARGAPRERTDKDGWTLTDALMAQEVTAARHWCRHLLQKIAGTPNLLDWNAHPYRAPRDVEQVIDSAIRELGGVPPTESIRDCIRPKPQRGWKVQTHYPKPKRSAA